MRGIFGDVRLDGLNCAFFVHFPGPVHGGNGTIQLMVEDKSDPRQRDALVQIMSGQETGGYGHHVVGVFGHVAEQAGSAIPADRLRGRRPSPASA